MAEEYTHMCSLQFTTRDGENLELDFLKEEAALAISEYIKQHPPINLGRKVIPFSGR